MGGWAKEGGRERERPAGSLVLSRPSLAEGAEGSIRQGRPLAVEGSSPRAIGGMHQTRRGLAGALRFPGRGALGGKTLRAGLVWKTVRKFSLPAPSVPLTGTTCGCGGAAVGGGDLGGDWWEKV